MSDHIITCRIYGPPAACFQTAARFTGGRRVLAVAGHLQDGRMDLHVAYDAAYNGPQDEAGSEPIAAQSAVLDAAIGTGTALKDNRKTVASLFGKKREENEESA